MNKAKPPSSAVAQRRVAVFGGYGTFGTHVSRELAARGVRVTVIGRSPQKCEAAAASLGPPHRGAAADVQSLSDCRRVIHEHRVAVHCAGPFHEDGTALLDACLDCRCHYVDIAEDRPYITKVRQRGSRLEGLGLTAAFGCSSLPAISGAAATVLCQTSSAPPVALELTLFIGHNNPKGVASVRSAARQLGTNIEAPQGNLAAFGGRRRVQLPGGFGKRIARFLNSADYDLLPAALGVSSVTVRVCFQSRIAGALFALAAMAPAVGRRAVPWLARCAEFLPRWGTSGGAVMAESIAGDGQKRRLAVVAIESGQRLAALPAVYAAKALAEGEPHVHGAVTAYEMFGARSLLSLLEEDSFRIEPPLAMFDTPA